MQVCIFEDEYWSRLEPLSYSRPVYDLVCGIFTLKEKILSRLTGEKYSLHCRKWLEESVRHNNPGIEVNKLSGGDYLFINGRVLEPEKLMELVEPGKIENKVFLSGGAVAAAKVSGKELLKIDFANPITPAPFYNIPSQEIEVKLAGYLWDLIYANEEELLKDFQFLTSRRKSFLNGKIHEGVYLVNKENIFIAEGAEVKPGTVIDASEGPVYIDKDAVVFPNSTLLGPVYIGKSSQVKSGAVLHSNVTVSKICKIGGEVEDTIMLPYSNKQHQGFIGHAYLGSWVNLGADTNCSDLNNNYSPVKAYVNGSEVNTGKQFLGLIMGDHSKAAINTMFNTGTVVGFSCNIFGAGFPDKNIPSFSWGGTERMETYKTDKCIETAKKVMKRRNIDFSTADEEIFNKIFELTKEEREKKGYSD